MAFVPSAIFNILENDANYRKIVAQIETVPAPGAETYNVYFRVDGPIAPLRIPDFNTPDDTMTSGSPIATMPLVNLPVDSTGATLEGTYKLTYFVELSTTHGVYTEVISQIDLNVLKEGPDNCVLVGNIGFEVNCVCYSIKVTDNTDYKGSTIISKEIEIILPTIPNQATPTPVTTDQDTITIGFDYSNVTYIVNLYTEYSNTNTDGTITVIENLIAQYSSKIVCDFNLCALVNCIADKFREIESTAQLKGGYPNLPLYLLDLIEQIELNLHLLELSRICGNYTKVYYYYNRLKDLLGCNCGCSSDGNTEHPIAVSPACGGAGGNITNITGVGPVVVNQSGTTAIISLDPNFLNSIGIEAINIAPGVSTEYLSVAADTPTARNTRITFNETPLLWGSWTEFTDASVASVSTLLKYSSVNYPLRYRIHDKLKLMAVEGQVEVLQNYVVLCLNFDTPIDLTNYPGARNGQPVAGYDTSGNCVGVLYLLLGTGQAQLNFSPNANFAGTGFVWFNGIINLD